MHLKVVILLVLAFILICLGLSFYFVLRDNGQTTRAVKTLAWCLLWCAAFLLLVLVGISRGWILPHGI